MIYRTARMMYRPEDQHLQKSFSDEPSTWPMKMKELQAWAAYRPCNASRHLSLNADTGSHEDSLRGSDIGLDLHCTTCATQGPDRYSSASMMTWSAHLSRSISPCRITITACSRPLTTATKRQLSIQYCKYSYISACEPSSLFAVATS